MNIVPPKKLILTSIFGITFVQRNNHKSDTNVISIYGSDKLSNK